MIVLVPLSCCLAEDLLLYCTCPSHFRKRCYWKGRGLDLSWIESIPPPKEILSSWLKLKKADLCHPRLLSPDITEIVPYISYCQKTWSKCCFTLLNSINTTTWEKTVALYFYAKDPTENLCSRESSSIQWEMFTAYLEIKHHHCFITDKKAETRRSFTQGHEGCRKWSWEKRLIIFTCQEFALCPEHCAVPVFPIDEKKDVWVRVKTCRFVKK